MPSDLPSPGSGLLVHPLHVLGQAVLRGKGGAVAERAFEVHLAPVRPLVVPQGDLVAQHLGAVAAFMLL